MPEYQAPKGTHDVLPPESDRWQSLIARFASAASGAGFGLLHTPLFEDLDVFRRLGASTDVVNKEMYDFEDKGGRHLALKPESTASTVRSFVQHRPSTPWKVWYFSPHFRYENTQAGRYRQFHQFGIETLGTDDPDADVEVIALGWRFYESLGLRGIKIHLNSLGDEESRPRYREALKSHLESNREALPATVRERLEDNPLRALDAKDPVMKEIVESAPIMLDFLSGASRDHLERVTSGLRALSIPFELDTKLVRGLDYYTRTTFSYVGSALEGAQNEVGGGGRYDGLSEALGGPPTPGVGFALGVERILLACDAEGVFTSDHQGLDAFIVDVTGGTEARDLADELRQAGLRVDRAYDNRSMKSQVKGADKSGARFAIIIGDDEKADGRVTLRDLRSESDQESVSRGDLTSTLRKKLS